MEKQKKIQADDNMNKLQKRTNIEKKVWMQIFINFEYIYKA